jgi:hypothetical protein
MPTIRIYSLPDDGSIASHDYPVWSDAHNDASPQSPDTASINADAFARNIVDPTGVALFTIGRTFLYFDTTVLPDTAVINDVTLNLYGIAIAGFPGSAKIAAQKGTQQLPLVAGDFNAYSGNLYNVPAVWQTSQYNVIMFDSQGRNDINKTGITSICCREYDHDYADVAPASGVESRMSFHTSNDPDQGKWPFIDVTYIIPDNRPSLGGFSIENDESNLHVNVQDTNGNLIDGAAVTITYGSTTINTSTDNNGCFGAMVKPLVRCDLSIVKPNYITYISKFILVPDSILTDPSKNFVFRVEDSAGAPVVGASVTIVSSVHSLSGTTGTNGAFEGEIETAFINDLTISKPGFTTYTHQFQSFFPFTCSQAGFRVVPIIELTV